MEITGKLPEAPAKIFFVGIGGIGMSGLAQLLRWQGYTVAGSDRGLQEPGKAFLYEALRRQGIRLYPQDGSGVLAEKPDALVASAAVEEGNPDFIEGIPRIHRACALSQALRRIHAPLITIAGSCGKTSVTGWIAAALRALGQNVLMVNGGYAAEKHPLGYPGNFYTDENPQWLVAEVDESDRSISEFSPDYGVLLNIGNDHYTKEELQQVFASYLQRCKSGVAILQDLAPLAESCQTPASFFSPVENHQPNCVYPANYWAAPSGIHFEVEGFGNLSSCQFGRHSASNACAVLALLKLLPLRKSPEELAKSIAAFQGVRQRFEIMGSRSNGTVFINDFAHNPEKVEAALNATRERYGSPILAIFQPHGFTPLGFMRKPLAEILSKLLQPEDKFLMLPVFYAGGTANFTPTSEEVVQDLKDRGLPAQAVSRDQVPAILASMPKCNAVLVMGARDSSLRDWTLEIL